jgi:hypothetical protein
MAVPVSRITTRAAPPVAAGCEVDDGGDGTGTPATRAGTDAYLHPQYTLWETVSQPIFGMAAEEYCAGLEGRVR